MPDLQAGQEPEGTEPNSPEQQAAEEAAAAEAAAAEAAGASGESAGDGDGEAPAAEGTDDGTPEWKAKQEASANRDAAKYRVQLREAQSQLADRDATIAELQAQVAQLTGKVTEATRTTIASTFGLPKALADVLTGDTEEELRAHAETLSQFAGGPQRTHFRSSEGVGGLDPFEGAESSDVSTAVAAARAQRY